MNVTDQPKPAAPTAGAVDPAALRAAPTMAEALAALEASSLPPETRRRVANDVKVALAWLGRDAAAVPADPKSWRGLLAAWKPVTFGVSAKRLANVKCSVRRALEAAQVLPRRPKPELHPSWRKLCEALTAVAVAEPRLRWRRPPLKAFARWCTAVGVGPAAVDQRVYENYAAWREAHDLSRDPIQAAQVVRTSWNLCATLVPCWPRVELRPRSRPERRCLPLDAFPRSFAEDLARYARQRGVKQAAAASGSRIERLRAGRGRPGPLNPSTAEMHGKVIHLAASALVRQGARPASAITSVAEAANAEAAALLCDDLAERDGGLATGYAGSLVRALRSVANRWRDHLTPEELDDFAALRADAEAGLDVGVMPARDRALLARFHQAEVMADLVVLPEKTLAGLEVLRARSDGVPTKAMARKAEAATLLLLQLTLPVRRSVLARTRLDNLVAPQRRGGEGRLVYHPADNTKTRTPLVAPLGPRAWGLLQTYLRTYRPLLRAPGDPTDLFLFPGARPGRAKTGQAAAQACMRLVHDGTGVKAHVHILRKVLGGWLLARTRSLDLVKALLGHTAGSRATQVYVELQSSWAAQALDAEIERLRAAHAAPPNRRRGERR